MLGVISFMPKQTRSDGDDDHDHDHGNDGDDGCGNDDDKDITDDDFPNARILKSFKYAH